MLYSYNGQYPKPIPFRIVLSNGNTRTDSSSFTPEEVADAGYILVLDKPIPEINQIISWDSQTLSWVIYTKTAEELLSEEMALTAAREVANKQLRADAYRNESDPLFFKWQRGEIDKQVWLDKVAEIKTKYA